nr:hypothetical protein [Microvirga massiliensis]
MEITSHGGSALDLDAMTQPTKIHSEVRACADFGNRPKNCGQSTVMQFGGLAIRSDQDLGVTSHAIADRQAEVLTSVRDRDGRTLCATQDSHELAEFTEGAASLSCEDWDESVELIR